MTDLNEVEDLPLYRVLNEQGFFADDDTRYPVGSEIRYTGTPNEQMEPLNDAAKIRMREYLNYLDDCQATKDRIMGRAFTGRISDLASVAALALADEKELVARKERAMPVHNPDKVERPDQVPLAQRRKRNTHLKAAKAPSSKGKTTAIRALGGNDGNDAGRSI